MPRSCKKVLGWISKAGDATICKRPKLDDDNNSIICPNTSNIERSHSTGRKHKPLIKHETSEKETWRNKVGGEFTPSGRKKHKSLPISRKSTASNPEEGTSTRKIKSGNTVDTRRFCMVDPFNLGGHRRSYTLDTALDITAFFDTVVKDEETPATILIAKKENLSRNSRFSIQPIRRNNSKKQPIANDIREVEVRTFRWESRRINREKTCSQLYELYEKLYEKQQQQLITNNNSKFFVLDFRDKPLPPIPKDNDNNIRQSTIKDSDTIIDPDFQSIIDTFSIISSSNYTLDDSIDYTPTSTPRESFSELLITEEVVLDLHEDDASICSTDSINSVETLPVEVEMCLSCKRSSTDSDYNIQWCKKCEMKRFEEQFESWSSGNDDIDCFILETQLCSTGYHDCLEWISYDRFRNIVPINTNDTTFQAIWLDGPRKRWDIRNNRYVGCGECIVALIRFEVPQNSFSNFFDQLSKQIQCENNNGTHIARCYGITRNPKSEEYMLVFQYTRDGNLSNYLKQNFSGITWKRKLEILCSLSKSLSVIHEKNLVHGNLNDGNVLLDDSLTLLSDLGMSRLNEKYGVLPFISPELLENKPYTAASDIYSFGTIMWELMIGKEPFADRSHNEELAMEICKQELRPEIPTDIPEFYSKLLKQCWSSNPFERPCANMLHETIRGWIIKEISPISSTPPKISIQSEENTSTNVHSEAVHTDDNPNDLIFTKSLNSEECLAIQQYIANETKFYNLKINSLEAENSEISAEIYDILQYW